MLHQLAVALDNDFPGGDDRALDLGRGDPPAQASEEKGAEEQAQQDDVPRRGGQLDLGLLCPWSWVILL
jgi:hypothetical protein